MRGPSGGFASFITLLAGTKISSLLAGTKISNFGRILQVSGLSVVLLMLFLLGMLQATSGEVAIAGIYMSVCVCACVCVCVCVLHLPLLQPPHRLSVA